MTYVTAAELRRFIGDLFVRVGMERGNADMVAESLVWANLRGVDTHGAIRLPRYLELIEKGLMNTRPEPKIVSETAVCVSIDADRAPGAVAMMRALDQAMTKARQDGLAMALVSRTTHTGALGYYTLKAAEAGFACLAVNAANPMMPYHGARGAAVGTNPISIAVPGGAGDPLVFDMATSIISNGRLLQARKTGTPLEPGWAVDKAGYPTTDPAEAVMAQPLGGPKGSGLSLMIECLASLLTGNALIADALQNTGEGARHRQNAMLIAIDVGRLMDAGAFRAQVERTVSALKALPVAPGGDDILMPGERGFRTMAERETSGIPLPKPVVDEIKAIAERHDVRPPTMSDTTVDRQSA